MRQFDLQRLASATRLGVDIVTDELGTVHVDAVDRAGSIQVKLGSDDLGVRTLLADRANELRAALGADGVSIESLDVGSRGDRPDGERSAGGDAANEQPPGTRGRAATAALTETTLDTAHLPSLAESRNPMLTVDGHVDVRI